MKRLLVIKDKIGRYAVEASDPPRVVNGRIHIGGKREIVADGFPTRKQARAYIRRTL